MTNLQIQFQEHLENVRHNKASEGETGRHNLAQESIGWSNVNENVRHNKAVEQFNFDSLLESKRHNQQQESINWFSAKSNDTIGRMNAAANSQNAAANWYNAMTNRELGSKNLEISQQNANTNLTNAYTNMRNADIQSARQRSDESINTRKQDLSEFIAGNDTVHKAVDSATKIWRAVTGGIR